jgi:hypothetical protein
MIRPVFILISIIFSFTGCNKAEFSKANDNVLISKKVNQLYSQYGLSSEAIYSQAIPDSLFSPELQKTLETAINVSKADIEKVKNSDHPDEKPLIFEGTIFSSLYEGYTGYKIQSISVNGKTAEASALFEYNMAAPKVIWTDTIYLINTQKGWKIDNITFDEKIAGSKDLKTNLTNFIRNTE